MEIAGGGIILSEELKDKLIEALQAKGDVTLSYEEVIEIVKTFEFVDEDD